jgi:hypothetical protein
MAQLASDILGVVKWRGVGVSFAWNSRVTRSIVSTEAKRSH